MLKREYTTRVARELPQLEQQEASSLESSPRVCVENVPQSPFTLAYNRIYQKQPHLSGRPNKAKTLDALELQIGTRLSPFMNKLHSAHLRVFMRNAAGLLILLVEVRASIQ